jgi:ATP synthase protein I
MFFELADDRQNDDLDRRIAQAKAEIDRPATRAQGAAESRGWAVGIEFVGTIVVCTLLGWLIDRFAHTLPWGMIVFLVLGFITAVYRTQKTSAQFDADDTTN